MLNHSGFLAIINESIFYRYISCQQTLLLPRGQAMQPLVPFDDELSKPLRDLATDSVIGVRIGVARLVATLFGKLSLPVV